MIAGRTGQEYNQRKKRHSAFWKDRYHAAAIEADEHLHRAVEHIDGAFTLREHGQAYDRDLGIENEPLRLEATVFREENAETAER